MMSAPTTSITPTQTAEWSSDWVSNIDRWMKHLGLEGACRVAFIGTEASGKTVFITALAKRLEKLGVHGWCLDPKNMATQRYVDMAWSQLKQGDWPAITSPGILPQLDWELRLPDGSRSAVRLIDPPGHDLRTLFTGSLQEIPPDLQTLAEYCRQAEIIVLLFNLKDACGESDLNKRSANELALKFAVDFVKQQGQAKYCCLVFTQVDQYQGIERQLGSWLHVANKYLPLLYAAHLADKSVQVMAVAAVNKTDIVKGKDGIARRMPNREFKSEGLDEILTWISASVAEVRNRSRREMLWGLTIIAGAGLLALLGIVFWIIIPLFHWVSGQTTAPQKPIPTEIHVIKGTRWEPFDHIFVAKVTVRNDGAEGDVTVLVTLEQNRKRWWKKATHGLKPGEVKDFVIEIKEYEDGPIYNWFREIKAGQ